MDTIRNSHHLNQDGISYKPVKNPHKIRVAVLLSSYQLEAWEYTMLEIIAKSEYASLELVLFNTIHNDTTNALDKILANRKMLLYSAYTRLENRFIHQKPDAFVLMDAKKLLEKIPVIELQPKTDTYSDWFEDDEVERIKKFNLDVIIRLGFRILKGDILHAAKYGVWSYHHDDNTVMRGNPPGFWETFERMGERGVILYRLTEDVDNGVVLYRSSFLCDYLFVRKNNNGCFLRSSLFVPRTLKRLSREGEDAFIDFIEREKKKLTFYNHKLYTPPTNGKFLKIALQHSCRVVAWYIYSQFFSRQWLLMYDLQDQISTSFWRFKKIVPPRDRFWADPHIFFKDDIYYIFIEEFIYKNKKAHISVIEMQQSGTFSDPVKVLEEPFHLSYPHVFEYDKTIYMIPETEQANSINLYECTVFPTEWKHKATLMDSVQAVDSTLLFHKNKWWLFTTISEPKGTPTNELYLFSSDDLLNNHWRSHPMNPILSDVKSARSAGKIIEREGKLYRPSQCGSPTYGYGIKLNEIVVLTETDYLEREITFIEPMWDRKLNGVHSFCHENRLTMIDGDYYKFITGKMPNSRPMNRKYEKSAGITMHSEVPNMKVREVEDTDLLRLADLLPRVFPPTTKEFWLPAFEWWWTLNPASSDQFPRGWILEKNKSIVGFIGNIPVKFRIGGTVRVAVASNSWYVDPSARGIFSFILFNKFLKQKGVPLFLFKGEDDKNIMNILSKYKFVQQILPTSKKEYVYIIDKKKVNTIFKTFLLNNRNPQLSRVLEYTKRAGLLLSAYVYQKSVVCSGDTQEETYVTSVCTSCDDAFFRLWEQSQNPSDATLSRDPKTLNWLYFSSANLHKRVVIQCHRLRDKTLAGYMVFDLVRTKTSEIGSMQLADMCIKDDDHQVLASLTSFAVTLGKQNNAALLIVWANSPKTETYYRSVISLRRSMPHYRYFRFSDSPEMKSDQDRSSHVCLPMIYPPQ